MSKLHLGIIGCGDFLRWQASDIKNSSQVSVAALFDPDTPKAEKFAAELGGRAVESADAIFHDLDINAVALFVPPWIRKDLFLKAAKAGKHVISTKPFGSYPQDCEEMQKAAQESGIKAAVIYLRTGDPALESLKDIIDSEKFGRLALYRHDWLHAYPQWNSWATDPDKNGGPFMDAMIHNLNSACYLMGREVQKSFFISNSLSHPNLKCADTESMSVQFKDNGVANLFITWAADLASNDTSGNNREHIDIFYLITDQGHHLSRVTDEGGEKIRVTKDGAVELISVSAFKQTHYDAFAEHCMGAAFPRRLATLEEASRDIAMVRQKPL